MEVGRIDNYAFSSETSKSATYGKTKIVQIIITLEAWNPINDRSDTNKKKTKESVLQC